MRDDEDAVDPEHVHAEYERLQARGHPTTGLRKISRRCRREAEHPQRLDAGVHARDHGDAGVGDAVGAFEIEGFGERSVGGKQVVEGVAHGVAATWSRSTRRRILPDGDFGSASCVPVCGSTPSSVKSSFPS